MEGRDEVDLFHPPPLAASRLSTGRRMGSSATRVACDAPEGQAEAADESRTTQRCNAEGRRLRHARESEELEFSH